MGASDRVGAWIDRFLIGVAPELAMRRVRARGAAQLMARHFEAAAPGRRTSGYSRLGTDANTAASGATLSTLRAQARDLVRNNPWARRGLRRICADTVGWGIKPKATGRGAELAMRRWKTWAETTECDAAGRLTFYGLQRLAMRTIVESGEVLIRRRYRKPVDGLSVPMQLQVLEPDYLDTGRDRLSTEAGGEIIQGVEFDAIGRRVAYWLFDRHPGGNGPLAQPVSRRVPADGVLHVFDQERPGQVRGPSWFASVDVRLHDFDQFEDATLVKAKIAACMAAFVTDMDGSGTGIAKEGTDQATDEPTETFEPGMIIRLPEGKQVTVANPPTASDHQSYSATALRGVAAGLGTTYEDLCGDYSQATYSSARMARLAHQGDVDSWLWHMLIPQFCAPVWRWMLQAMILANEDVEDAPAEWSPAPMPLLEPDKEASANQKMIRIGLKTWAQVVREQGLDPDAQLAEIKKYNELFDEGAIVLDCDPRKTNSSGQAATAAAPAGTEPSAGNESGGTDGGDGEDSGAGKTDQGGETEDGAESGDAKKDA